MSKNLILGWIISTISACLITLGVSYLCFNKKGSNHSKTSVEPSLNSTKKSDNSPNSDTNFEKISDDTAVHPGSADGDKGLDVPPIVDDTPKELFDKIKEIQEGIKWFENPDNFAFTDSEMAKQNTEHKIAQIKEHCKYVCNFFDNKEKKLSHLNSKIGKLEIIDSKLSELQKACNETCKKLKDDKDKKAIQKTLGNLGSQILKYKADFQTALSDISDDSESAPEAP